MLGVFGVGVGWFVDVEVVVDYYDVVGFYCVGCFDVFDFVWIEVLYGFFDDFGFVVLWFGVGVGDDGVVWGVEYWVFDEYWVGEVFVWW